MTTRSLCLGVGLVLAAACGGNKAGTDGGSTSDAGSYNQMPASGTITGGGFSATVTNAECLLMSPGASGAAGFVISASEDATDGGMAFSMPSDADGGFFYVNLQLNQIDAGVYSSTNGTDCGDVNFNFSSGLNGGLNGWGAGLDCDGGTLQGSWTLTLTSVGPPVQNGTTGGFLYQVNGSLTATMPTLFTAGGNAQANLTF